MSLYNLSEYTTFNLTVAAKNLAGYGDASNVSFFKTGVTGMINVTMDDGRPLYSYPGFEVGIPYRLRVVLKPNLCQHKPSGCPVGVTATHQVGGTTIELELKPPNIPCRLTRNYVGDSTNAPRLNVTFDDDVDESNDVYLFCYNKSATSMSRLIATEIIQNL